MNRISPVLDDRRRLEWLMRFGEGHTLDEISRAVGVSREVVRVDVAIVMRRCILGWKAMAASSPVVRRLKDAGALSPQIYHDVAAGCQLRWKSVPEIPPMEEV